MSTKSDVLAVLERNRNHAISGQELANILGVSRNAVWKAIKALQDDGHIINAVTNKGYRLEKGSDLISAEGVKACLPDAFQDSTIQVFPVIDSTNTQAKLFALEGAAHGTVVIADEQTAGRGRFGKRFFSPKDTGLYMSVILRPRAADMADAQMITVAAAVAVCEAIESLTGLQPQIKWVNDLYLDGKKICGILTEAVSDFESGQIESIVLGVGINCTTAAFPEELRSIAGSLGTEGLSRNRLAAAILCGIMDISANLQDESVIARYKSRSLMIGKAITYEQGGTEIFATVLDINDKGNLIVKLESGETRILSSGEVTIRKTPV